MKQINFFLPEFYGNFRLIIYLHDLMEQSPEFFFEGAKIAAAYGAFPGSIWNGGRVIHGFASKEEMQLLLSEMNARDIAVRYTFTNPLLENYHIADTYCNLAMELGDNGKNEVLVNSPVLERYIREGFPKYRLISSTTKCLRTILDVKKELEKDYALVVLDSSFNNVEELFSLENKEKVELIANHYCMDNCPKREKHYEQIGRAQLAFSQIDFEECPNIKRSFYEIMDNKSFITVEDLYGKYAAEGFCNFKIDGRGFNRAKVLESFVYYLVKPVYRDRVRLQIMTDVYGK